MMNSKEFFDVFLAGKIAANPQLASDAGLRSQSVSVEIDGNGWTLAFDDRGAAKLMGGNTGKDCVIQMNEKTWDGLLSGSLNVPLAVMTRKIKIKGDVGTAAKLGMAIKKLGEKS